LDVQQESRFLLMPPYATPEVTTDPQDYYWDSEYYCNDRPAKFRSQFVIHIQPQGITSTRIDVIEFQPEVWGKTEV
jgi:hypothetical protein